MTENVAEGNIESGIEGEHIESGMEEGAIASQEEKGYGLPVSDEERSEAETDLLKIMDLISDEYEYNVERKNLSEQDIADLAAFIAGEERNVRNSKVYFGLANDAYFDAFLNQCQIGKAGERILYEVHSDGGLTRKKYIFDGKEMYLLAAGGSWNEKGEPAITYVSRTRIENWRYTEKGYFCYELCVPEYPEVTEVVDGSCLFRVKALDSDKRELSEKCLYPLGYQGNNLLCSDWDLEHMENLDYNGLYEYLFAMKYGEKYDPENSSAGILRDDFESLITEYLPIDTEQLREYAAFDVESQTYYWAALGCGNYSPTFFGTSFPEVVDIQENQDGTVTLTVDAVCEMMLCDDAVITHRLTVKFAEDGSFQYLGNEILDDGVKNIPAYQYRIGGR